MEFRIVVLRVANVSTVEYTADIRFSVVFEWRDPRLGGVDFGPWGQPLPGHLWGPTLMLGNSVPQPTIVQTGCSLVDEKDRELVMRPVAGPTNTQNSWARVLLLRGRSPRTDTQYRGTPRS